MLKRSRLHRSSSMYTSRAGLKQEYERMFGDGVVPTLTLYISLLLLQTHLNVIFGYRNLNRPPLPHTEASRMVTVSVKVRLWWRWVLGLRLGLGLCCGWYSDNYRHSAACELNTICHVEKSTFTSKWSYIYVPRRITTEKWVSVKVRLRWRRVLWLGLCLGLALGLGQPSFWR